MTMKRSTAKRLRHRANKLNHSLSRTPKPLIDHPLLRQRSMYYGRNGEPISFAQWAIRFEDRPYKIVQQSYKDGIKISTVWLGMDHGFMQNEPVIFETMVFGGRLDSEMWRYSTLSDARKGHTHAVKAATGRPMIGFARPRTKRSGTLR